MNTLDPNIQALFAEKRFHGLVKYFQNVEIGDLRLLEERDLVEQAEQPDKLLMKIFVRDRLHKFLHGNEQIEDRTPLVARTYVKCDLDLTTIICSSAAEGMFQGRHTIKQYISSEMFKSDQLKRETIKSISLARCLLNDMDMSFLQELMSFFPSCLYLDLSENRLHGIRQDSKKMLDSVLLELMHRKVLINMCGNPFSTIDRLDFFQTLPLDIFRYLLFVPQYWLERAGWYALIQGRENFNDLANQISLTHLQFYTRGNQQQTS